MIKKIADQYGLGVVCAIDPKDIQLNKIYSLTRAIN